MMARERLVERINQLFGAEVAWIHREDVHTECILVTNERHTEDIVFDYYERRYINRGLVRLMEEYGAHFEWKNPGALLVYIPRH